jgi:hypothetical protein
MTYVADLTEAAKAGPSFGLWAPGFLWIDDVTLERVGNEVKLTEAPVFDKEESPIEPPAALGDGAIHCPRCSYRNMPGWKKCYACGADLETKTIEATGPPTKLITSFEQKNPFSAGAMVAEHATEGTHALRLDNQLAIMDGKQNWEGYDFLKVDMYGGAKDPIPLYMEIQDTGTTGYWTRVNYNAIVPPGASTLTIPLKQLYVGEKARPGRNVILSGITRLVFAATSPKPAPFYIDNLRLERDLTGGKAGFEGLYAFDLGPGGSPVLDGFRPLTPATIYSKGRGFGLKDAKIWRDFNVLQPDPLYQDYLCIESGGIAIDVPNGKWRDVMNIDAAAGFWGETQAYRQRTVLAQGKPVVNERMSFDDAQKKYYAFWDKDDLPAQNVFDKYDKGHFSEKTFDVDVTNGQLFVEFKGENTANSVSSFIAFPVEKAAEGAKFLEYARERRRFYFDNSFKRVLHRATGEPLAPSAADSAQGAVLFQRDLMKDLFYDDTPGRSETGKPLTGDGFQGQVVTLVAGVAPLKDLGPVKLAVSDLSGAGGNSIPANAVEIGYGSYRVSRVTMDGAVYTIEPRWILPKTELEMPKGVTRSLWLTIHVPANTAPGVYEGKLLVTQAGSAALSMPMRFTVRKGTLDAVTIPVGPFGGSIRAPWIEGDPESQRAAEQLYEKSLRLLRERNFTMFSGIPTIPYEIKDGHPTLHFYEADRQMRQAKNLGFVAVSSYGAGIGGITAYFQDLDKMKASGYSNYTSFIRAVYNKVQQHARENDWITVFWNIGDEPLGEELNRSLENAKAYRAAFPKGPPYFTVPTSLNAGKDATDPNFQLVKTLSMPAIGAFDDAGIRMLLAEGGEWGSYNGGNRWTYGTHLYKGVTEFGMKFRITWHWNIVAGDPYYALDSREDDYAWANSSPGGKLVPSIEFARICAGLDDYRALTTAARLAKAKAGTPAAKAAESLIGARMASFHLADKDHDALFGIDDWEKFRKQLYDALEALQ